MDNPNLNIEKSPLDIWEQTGRKEDPSIVLQKSREWQDRVLKENLTQIRQETFKRVEETKCHCHEERGYAFVGTIIVVIAFLILKYGYDRWLK